MTHIYHTCKSSHRTQYFVTKKDDVNHTVYAVHELADPADPPTSENLIGHVSSIFYARRLVAAPTEEMMENQIIITIFPDAVMVKRSNRTKWYLPRQITVSSRKRLWRLLSPYKLRERIGYPNSYYWRP